MSRCTATGGRGSRKSKLEMAVCCRSTSRHMFAVNSIGLNCFSNKSKWWKPSEMRCLPRSENSGRSGALGLAPRAVGQSFRRRNGNDPTNREKRRSHRGLRLDPDADPIGLRKCGDPLSRQRSRGRSRGSACFAETMKPICRSLENLRHWD